MNLTTELDSARAAADAAVSRALRYYYEELLERQRRYIEDSNYRARLAERQSGGFRIRDQRKP